MKIHPSEIFKVLGVESRLKILELLKTRGPLGAKTIAEELGITPAAVSQHLKVLRQVDLVKNERKGYYIPYSVDVNAMEQCRVMMVEVCRCGCGPQDFEVEDKPENVSLSDLQEYKKVLEGKLKEVEDRISQIKKEKD